MTQRHAPDLVPLSTLHAAVERGILSDAQLAELLALREDGDVASPREEPAPRRRVDGIVLAYGAGALAVLFAMGWFLADRWRSLGDVGVFGVTLGYAALFLVAARLLRRDGYALPANLAVTLAVAVVPIMTWAALRASGLWPDLPAAACGWDDDPIVACHARWMAVQLATVLAALVALRRVRFGLLTAPIGAALVFFLMDVIESLGPRTASHLAGGWALVFGASLLAALAHLVDRRTVDAGEDYGLWLWIAACVAGAIGMGQLWGGSHGLRHALVAVGVVTAVASLSLRRRVVLVFGAGCIVFYLGWLAFDVFEHVLAFPIALAAFGLSVILVTVLVQRHAPALVSRLRLASDDGRPRMPGGYPALLAPALLAVLCVSDARRVDRERAADDRVQQVIWRNRMHREGIKHRREEAAKRAGAGLPPETGAVKRP